MVLTVTLLGGESSGKTTLAEALQHHLNQTSGINTLLVSEQLRSWCLAMGRAPRADEQAARAEAQTHSMATATRQPGVQVVVADTSALMVAAYSDQYFNDTSLYPAALASQRSYDLTLLMGLDIPWVSDGLLRDSPAAREATDSLLRRELLRAGIAFQLVYGPLEARQQQALRAIGTLLGRSLTVHDTTLTAGRVPMTCEGCDDPDCESRSYSRLFSRLI